MVPATSIALESLADDDSATGREKPPPETEVLTPESGLADMPVLHREPSPRRLDWRSRDGAHGSSGVSSRNGQPRAREASGASDEVRPSPSPRVTHSSGSLASSPAAPALSESFRWRDAFAKMGPAFLISIGYMDPGNWATDIEGGSRFGYQLLWVLVASNAMAVLLQTLTSRMGIVTQRHLAQLCREVYPFGPRMALFASAQLAIVATDLAEVLGTAIGLNLLLGIPLLLGVLLTALDTLVLLMAERYGMRRLEQLILTLLGVIGASFVIELVLSRPSISEVAAGLVPHIDGDSLYIALGMVGATVMPHNFYLHSALVIRRPTPMARERHEEESAAPPPHRAVGMRKAADAWDRNGDDNVATPMPRSAAAVRLECRYALLDCAVALHAALFINAAILIVAAAVFYKHHIPVNTLQDAHAMLERVLQVRLFGRVELAPLAFGIALIAAGQSSTLTGTLAGQYVMDGFLGVALTPWKQRLLTRLCAVLPSCAAIAVLGTQSTYRLLILSQVILSLQLPFAIVPVIRFTGDARLMSDDFVNGRWVRLAAWSAAAFVIALNMRLVLGMLYSTAASMPRTAGMWAVALLGAPLVLLALAFLLWLIVYRGRAAESETVRNIEVVHRGQV
ncbi:hypothetical protein CDCA_CDCA01G0389 [Cyanidium caldarium]|uniref:Uncharacterized protein n=1 Tax=Cyanidium caldarium TaxID=2771 RepID=A0AAV9IQG2_CYACA|nr:hypothetical protein CDCA_CDCA01G0389 [Cyanidium caldarium]